MNESAAGEISTCERGSEAERMLVGGLVTRAEYRVTIAETRSVLEGLQSAAREAHPRSPRRATFKREARESWARVLQS
jgi:hypothetical protein